jgi:hypothetical protein
MQILPVVLKLLPVDRVTDRHGRVNWHSFTTPNCAKSKTFPKKSNSPILRKFPITVYKRHAFKMILFIFKCPVHH